MPELSAEQAERLDATFVCGDYEWREWTREEGSRVFVDGSLVVQVRRSDNTLVASTVNGDGYGPNIARIDTDGTDLTADPPRIFYAYEGDQSSRVPPGDYREEISAMCVINGQPRPQTIRRSRVVSFVREVAVDGGDDE